MGFGAMLEILPHKGNITEHIAKRALVNRCVPLSRNRAVIITWFMSQVTAVKPLGKSWGCRASEAGSDPTYALLHTSQKPAQ